MGVKPDVWIRQMTKCADMIAPFSERVDGADIVSYGLQPAGYDARLAPEVDLIDWTIACGLKEAKALDPLNPSDDFYVKKSSLPNIQLPPNSCMRARTVEYFRIPRNIVVRGATKTTYASLSINIDVAGIHPGWEGRLRLHVSNVGKAPVILYGLMGIVYLEFHEVDGEVERAYGELAHPAFQGNRT